LGGEGEEGIFEGWRAAKDAGLGDGVRLRMLAWRREGDIDLETGGGVG